MPCLNSQPSVAPGKPAVMMSVDSHSFHHHHHTDFLDVSDQNMLSIYHNKDVGDVEEDVEEINDCNEVSESVSMTSVNGERVAADDYPQTMFGQSASDTGYQTASLNTLLVSDMSVATELLKSQKSTSIAVSPQKVNNPSWEPSGASTPNKLSVLDFNKENLFKPL